MIPKSTQDPITYPTSIWSFDPWYQSALLQISRCLISLLKQAIAEILLVTVDISPRKCLPTLSLHFHLDILDLLFQMHRNQRDETGCQKKLERSKVILQSLNNTLPTMNIYWKQTLKTANILARYSLDATGHFRFHRSNNIYIYILLLLLLLLLYQLIPYI